MLCLIFDILGFMEMYFFHNFFHYQVHNQHRKFIQLKKSVFDDANLQLQLF
jgi:hypothetical protein